MPEWLPRRGEDRISVAPAAPFFPCPRLGTSADVT